MTKMFTTINVFLMNLSYLINIYVGFANHLISMKMSNVCCSKYINTRLLIRVTTNYNKKIF